MFKSVSQCDRCLRRKAIPHRAPLVNMTTTQPLEMICVNFLSLEPSKGGIENILMVTDHFTRYSQAFPTRNQTAKTTAFLRTTSYTTDFQPVSTVTKVETSRVPLLSTSAT